VNNIKNTYKVEVVEMRNAFAFQAVSRILTENQLTLAIMYLKVCTMYLQSIPGVEQVQLATSS
jgi:hypothetical protein